MATGLDIQLLPPVSRVVAVDLTLEMLRRAATAGRTSPVDFALADGAELLTEGRKWSAVVLHLVVRVAPDPREVPQETARILCPGGRVAILDHFAAPGRLGVPRRLLTLVLALLGTHLDRTFEDTIAGLPFLVAADRLLARGIYRGIVLELAVDASGFSIAPTPGS